MDGWLDPSTQPRSLLERRGNTSNWVMVAAEVLTRVQLAPGNAHSPRAHCSAPAECAVSDVCRGSRG